MPNQSTYQMTRAHHTLQQEELEVDIGIEQLVKEYYPYIRRLAYSILDDLAEAEDAAQETFVSAHQSLERFREQALHKTWLTAIAVNVCRGRLRKRKTQHALITTLQAIHLLRRSPPSPEP